MTKKKEKTVKEPEIEKEPGAIKKFFNFWRNETVLFILGIVFLLLALYLAFAFTSFLFNGGNDMSAVEQGVNATAAATDNGVNNHGGAVGAVWSNFLINRCFGLSAYFIIFFLVMASLRMIRVAHLNVTKWFITSFFGLVWFSLLSGYALEPLFKDSFINPGGMHGHNISRWLCSQLGGSGFLLLLLVTAIFYSIYMAREATMRGVRSLFHISLPHKKEVSKDDDDSIETADAASMDDDSIATADTTSQDDDEVPFEIEPSPQEEEKAGENDADKDDGFVVTNGEQESDEDADEEKESPLDEKEENEPQGTQPAAVAGEPEFIIEGGEEEEPDAAYAQQPPYNPKLDLEYYKYPTLDLLNSYDDNTPAIDMEEQKANKDRIVNVLHNFGIEISTIKASVGPTITLYEITPAAGVRISKIRNLEDDIALSLSALGIRIIAPIPGKGTIGIEVPNSKKLTVSMQSVLNSKKYQESTFELPVALGKTITNEVFMVDLCKMPHLLVAGATGMGKSVGLNALITSLIYKKHPAELKFVMIDPKKVEFSVYEPIEKHFLAKLPDDSDAIITDVTKVVHTLKSLCTEMDSRYDLLKKAHVRTIKDYNDKFVARQLNPNKGHRFMPYIVVIIDEFGDLIMTAGKEIELPIARIAQLARAVGIHMVIATQRPTTNIITGTIKANFPARMAFRVAAMMDSRTILDRPGANQLVGRGDMLFLAGSDPVRVQCAFVDTPEIERLCDYVSRQQSYPTPYYLPEFVDDDDEKGAAEVDMDRLDPMFEEAARLVVIHQQGSTSLIQRKFSIGYNRAGRIMDQLEAAGIVSPAEGSKPRQVMCTDEADLEFRLNSILKRS